MDASSQRHRLAPELGARSPSVPAPLGIALLTADLCWTCINSALCQIFRCPPSQLLNRNLPSLCVTEDWRQVEAQLGQVWSGALDEVHAHVRLLAQGSVEAPCLMRISRLNSQNGVQLIVLLEPFAAIRHESGQRREERPRDELLATLGHELRNPLAALSQATELLLRSELPPSLTRLGRILDRQTRQMRYMVDELLDHTRVNEGKIHLRRSAFDLVELVRHVVDDHAPIIEGKGLVLRLEAPPDIQVHHDRVRVTQILQNLLDNATKFTEPPGEVVVRLAHDCDTDTVELAVVDTGLGMDEDTLQGAFEPFRSSTGGGGLGLGLSLVRRLAEMHGGAVQAWSPGKGGGTKVCVTLPRSAGEPVPEGEVHCRGSVRKVLVVEDHEDSAETLRELLELLGYQVDVAYDAAAALQCCERTVPDLVLCDIGLPGPVSSYQLAQEVRNRWGRDVCLVALTGYGTAHDEARSLAAGFDAHMRKPLDLDALERVTANFVLSSKAPG